MASRMPPPTHSARRRPHGSADAERVALGIFHVTHANQGKVNDGPNATATESYELHNAQPDIPKVKPVGAEYPSSHERTKVVVCDLTGCQRPGRGPTAVPECPARAYARHDCVNQRPDATTARSEQFENAQTHLAQVEPIRAETAEQPCQEKRCCLCFYYIRILNVEG